MARLNHFSAWLLLAVAGFSSHLATAQSNYGLQGIDQEYAEGLPPRATLAGKVTELDTLNPQISLNRTQAHLNCAAGSMLVQLSFKEPFWGLAYSDFDRNSACYTKGNGLLTSTLELPLKGCGTRQDPQRVFTNNIVVRFHRGLEMEGDEVITIVCRYPPPKVEAPPLAILPPIVAPPPLLSAPLKEMEVLLIICALLFLGLMLLGLGFSYYCLKQRNIQVIRKVPFSPIDDDTASSIESVPALKIPRAHAPPSSTTSSEPPQEETIASDYPSSLEEHPHRPDTVSSEYSDTHPPPIGVEIVPPAVRAPEFKVNMRIAQHPELPQQYYDDNGSVSSFGTGIAMETTIPDLHPPPRTKGHPPIFSQVQGIREPKRAVQETEHVDNLTVVDREDVDTETRYMQPLALRKPERTVHTVDDVFLQTIVEKRLIEDEERTTREVTQFYKKDEPNKWDVVIRNHPGPDDDTWDRASETTDNGSSIGWSVVDEPLIRPHYSVVDRESINTRTEVNRDDTTTVTRAMQRLQMDDTRSWNERWQVLLRVLEAPPLTYPPQHQTHEPLHPDTASDVSTDYAPSEAASVLTDEDREKWRQIITTESTLRTLLTQATVREDYERIRRDTRYEKLFEPEKWDVIIRVLAPPQPDTDDEPRFYSDTPSEGSSVGFPLKPNRRHHHHEYTTVSSSHSGAGRSVTDVRSMTEVMVDFGHAPPPPRRHRNNPIGDGVDDDDDSSIASSFPGGPRSTADRSQTEIVEFAPLEDDFDFNLLPIATMPRDDNNTYATQDHQTSTTLDDDGNLVTTTSSSKRVFSSSSRVMRS